MMSGIARAVFGSLDREPDGELSEQVVSTEQSNDLKDFKVLLSLPKKFKQRERKLGND